MEIWNLRVQKNQNIEKIIFKVVQMKFLAMHITNHYVYGRITATTAAVFSVNFTDFFYSVTLNI